MSASDRKSTILSAISFVIVFGAMLVWSNWDGIKQEYMEKFHPDQVAAENAKAKALWESVTRVVETHLLTRVTHSGNSFVGRDAQTQVQYLITVEGKDEDCLVMTPQDVADAEKAMGGSSPFDMSDEKKPIYLVRVAHGDWEIRQGIESCSVNDVKVTD